MTSSNAFDMTTSNTSAFIGRFELLKKLGQGAQGVVYHANDTQLQREVAIKLLNKIHKDSKIIQEARNVSNLKHKNIVQLYEIGVHDEKPYLVYEYEKGESLKKFIERHEKLKPLDAVKIITQLLSGLQFAHTNQIVHRDINPANILIDQNHKIKIMDFGISQPVGTETSTNEIIGTVNYLAPELLSGNNISPSVDIFSTGLILYELLTGRMVFAAENSMAVMYKISHETISPPTKFNKNLSSKLNQIVVKSLQRDLSQRYDSAESMLNDLNAYIGSFETAKESETLNGSNNSTIEFLLRRMKRKQDFPAISKNISEINSKSSIDGMSSANELSNIILEDYALTTKILRAVNSSYYGQFGGEITTISRAIIILGFEQVRSAALSIILFEHLKDAKQANTIKKEIYCSLMSAIIAREHAKDMNLSGNEIIETAFIASMFHELGKLLTIFYFDDEFNEIQNLISTQGLDELKACKNILGVSYSELGKGIAKEWQLPDVISQSMVKLPTGKIKPAEDNDTLIRQLTCFSNELCQIGISENDQDDAIKKLITRYAKILDINKNKIETLITNSTNELNEFVRNINLNVSDISFFDKKSNSITHNKNDISNSDKLGIEDNKSNENKQDILVNGIAEITNAMLGDYQVNNILTMVLETIYRGMAFNRVMFCLFDPKKSKLIARFGYGKSINDLIPKFQLPVSKDSSDVIHQSCIKGKEFIILDVNDNEYKNKITNDLKKLTNPITLVLYPLIVNKRVLGVIYADMDDVTTKISLDALKFFKTLRNQAALAIFQKQAK